MNITKSTSASPLVRYMAETRTFPMLAAEEEHELALRWRDSSDPEALRRLVGSHLRLVAKIAKSFGGYGLPLTDLISEGHVGLMQAAAKFDPDRGFRFSTYAMWWIRAAIQEYVLHSWSLVKMGTTAAQKKLFFNLRRLKAKLGAQNEGELHPATVAAISEALGVTPAEVTDMNRRLTSGDLSLNEPMSDGEGNEFLDFLPDTGPSQETLVVEADEYAKRSASLRKAIARLSDREQAILSARTLSEQPNTLQELGERFGVSRERIRQIESRAIDKLTRLMRGPETGNMLSQPA